MPPSHNEYRLTEGIVELSEATTWDRAKLEWRLHGVRRIEAPEEPETCLCGHHPIIEVCTPQNRENGNEAIVGNVGVKKFLGLPSDRIFDAVRRVARDETRALNAETIEHARTHRWINPWEFEFYFDTMRKRSLSERQMATRVKINRQILARVRGR